MNLKEFRKLTVNLPDDTDILVVADSLNQVIAPDFEIGYQHPFIDELVSSNVETLKTMHCDMGVLDNNGYPFEENEVRTVVYAFIG